MAAGRRSWLARLLARLLGSDAEWVLGDLEERRLRRLGPGRHLALSRDILSVAWWAVARPDATLDVLRQDIRQAGRGLVRDPAFTALATLTLALGMGLNTAVFGVVRGVLLEPLPYEEPERLVVLWSEIPARGVSEATSAYANVRDWRARSRVLDDAATFDPTTLTLTGGAWPERVSTVRASANLFDLLGVAPMLGRGFSAEEERGRAPVVVLGHGFWQERFGGSRDVLGRGVEINEATFEVIGVMPGAAAFHMADAELWLPQTLFVDWEASSARRGTDAWRVIARLSADATLEEARADLARVAAGLERAHPEANAGLGVSVVPLHEQIAGPSFRLSLWMLYGAVGMVLLIAYANAAHLILARGLARAPELSLRAALGATTSRLLRQTLTESAVLCTVAGAAGLLLAAGGLRAFVALAPPGLPRIEQVAIDGPVLIYGLGLTLALGVLLGILPTPGRARASRVYDALRGSRGALQGVRARRARSALVVGQVALAVVLVLGADLLLRSAIAVRNVDAGFEPEGVSMANLSVAEEGERVVFYERVVEEVRALPGVAGAAVVEDIFISSAPARPVTPEGGEPRLEDLRVDAVGGDFFEVLGVSLLEGRAFTESDGEDAVPVAIVNETMARRLWPGTSPIGRRFRTGGPDSGAQWIEVVGVVPDMRRQGLERAAVAQAFRPQAQAAADSRNMNLLVRTDVPVPGLFETIRARIAAIDATVPLSSGSTVEQGMDRYFAQRRFQTLLLTLFSAVALVLAAVGIYGQVQYSVVQRTRELGVRMALGARSGALMRMVLGRGLGLTLLGLAAGSAAALWLSRSVSALLYEVEASDPAALGTTAAVLLLSTVAACYGPARQAGRVDPMTALREG